MNRKLLIITVIIIALLVVAGWFFFMTGSSSTQQGGGFFGFGSSNGNSQGGGTGTGSSGGSSSGSGGTGGEGTGSGTGGSTGSGSGTGTSGGGTGTQGGAGTQGTGSGSSGSGDTISLPPYSGDSTPIVARNFLHDPGVIANPYHTTDYYILVGTDDPSAPNPPYEIDYSGKDQSFGVTLYKEPLGQYRTQAEQDLMKRLGISQTDMCRIAYVLAVGPGVNETFAGKNLGFSFCPGATALPQ